ncbi:hypothetical protein Tco_0843258 [Tanacetum coccineum]|uniref:Uncharacterized protein n=1 Tax=Tanacetum coccineum TaxID=301880 RepID=A0ABQ5B1K4_9ASTR
MEIHEVILFYNGLGIPTRQILDSRGAIPSKIVADAMKGSYGPQFSEAYFEASHIDNSIHRKEKDLGRASVSVMPLSTYLNLGLGELAHTKLTVELADRTVKYPKGIAENVLITLRIGEERIIFKSVKPSSSLIKRVYMLSLRERMELDLEARLMGETLVINRSLDLLNGDYIELNDLNEPFELRRNQGDNLMPTIEEGEVSDEDKNNGISHPYQKLKGFDKGVLNLGPDYIRDAKTEE